MSPTLPLHLGPLDHYTLIVEDAAAVARFHAEVLGFVPLRIQLVNAGSAPEGEHDMLNHVLQLPGGSERVLVITEGLTEDSIFRRYLDRYGAGVHHIAYEVADLDASLATLRAHGVGTTSEDALRDPLTGLRQIFVDRSHSGYFIELIERTEAATAGTFTHDNMAALAHTMASYLGDGDGSSAVADPAVTIDAPREAVVAFLLDPFNLPKWTGHRTVRRVGGRVVEVRLHGDPGLEVTADQASVRFTWRLGEASLTVTFRVSAVDGGTRIEAPLPPLPPDRLARTAAIIQTELDVLGCLLEGRPDDIEAAALERISAYHLEVYQRRGL